VTTDDPEVTELLDTSRELIEAIRRLLLLSGRLLSRATLTSDEAKDAKPETRELLEQLDAMLTLRRQQLRPPTSHSKGLLEIVLVQPFAPEVSEFRKAKGRDKYSFNVGLLRCGQ
jgi:hypothetical protein